MNIANRACALLLVLFGSAAMAGEAADLDVQKLADRWSEAYNKQDWVAIARLYTQDARLMMHGEPTLIGRARIADYWGKDVKQGNPLTVLKVTHAIRGVDMILVHGDYQVIDRTSGQLLGFGRFAHIWTEDERRQWRLDRDLWNQPFNELDAGTLSRQQR